jgi:hypothetical protein
VDTVTRSVYLIRVVIDSAATDDTASTGRPAIGIDLKFAPAPLAWAITPAPLAWTMQGA